jgi:polyvinyl alcohol dehydrogenase (cytochrome)
MDRGTLSTSNEFPIVKNAIAPGALLLLAFIVASMQAAISTAPADNLCAASDAFTEPFKGPQWNGWGVTPSQRRFQPAAMAQLSADQVPRLKLKWAFGFPNVTRAYAQPTVVGGRLFVASAGHKVYSLDPKSGCQYWAFVAEFPVRTAITVGATRSGWSVYFGDQHGSAYAVDALTGTLLWKRRVDEHRAAIITGAPTLTGKTLYVPTSSFEEGLGANPGYPCCTFRGSVSALDAATGAVRWKSYTIPEEPKPVRRNPQGVQLWGPSGAGVWSSPTVDLKARRVYVTTGDSYSDPAASTSDAFAAFDADTGRLIWSRQMTEGDAFNVACGLPAGMGSNCPEANGPDFDFGSSPMLVDLPDGRRALIAGQKSGLVYAVDPDQRGRILWQRRVGLGGRAGGVQWGSAADAAHVYVAVSDVRMEDGQRKAFTIDGVAVDDPETLPGAQPSAFGDWLLLDPNVGGGLFALTLEKGEVAWTTPHPGCNNKPGCSPAQSAAVTAIPGVVFSGGLDGHLRAYSARDGRIIWDVDTAQEYTTVNGVKASGGAIDGPGPVVVGGMVYVNSGYAFLGGAPGNVLLAFSVARK